MVKPDIGIDKVDTNRITNNIYIDTNIGTSIAQRSKQVKHRNEITNSKHKQG